MTRFTFIVQGISIKSVGTLLKALVTVIKVNYSRVVFALLAVLRPSIAQRARWMAQLTRQCQKLFVVTIGTTRIANRVVN